MITATIYFWTYKSDGSIMFAEWDDDAQAFVFPEPLGD